MPLEVTAEVIPEAAGPHLECTRWCGVGSDIWPKISWYDSLPSDGHLIAGFVNIKDWLFEAVPSPFEGI